MIRRKFLGGSSKIRPILRVFVLATGQRAVIGSLDRIEDMLAGSAGTEVCLASAGGADTL